MKVDLEYQCLACGQMTRPIIEDGFDACSECGAVNEGFEELLSTMSVEQIVMRLRVMRGYLDGIEAQHKLVIDALKREQERAEMARIMTNRRLATQAPRSEREPNCSMTVTTTGAMVFACRRGTIGSARVSASDDTPSPAGKQPLRAITLHAPWAWAICWLGKRVENRDWSRGVPDWLTGSPLAIHAGSARTWNPAGMEAVIDVAQQLPMPERIKARAVFDEWFPSVESCASAADGFCSRIVAVAIVDRCEPPLSGDSRMEGWRVSNQWGIYLRDVVVLKQPVPVDRGQLGLWTVAPDITEQVREQYRLSHPRNTQHESTEG